MERLQKIISQAGIASRREAEKMILAGQVSVNRKIITELGTKVDVQKDRIAVNGKPIALQEHVYILLYKPKGVITSLKDERGRKTVVDLLRDLPARVYPVGRLDYNTEGALLLTNDGALTNALIHPRYKVSKTYLATVQGMPPEETLDLLRAGIRLDDGVCEPALVRKVQEEPEKNRTQLEIVIHEGKNRQVRRMCEAIRFPVYALKRTKFASLTLSGLRRGQYRYLTNEEVDDLKRLTDHEADRHEKENRKRR